MSNSSLVPERQLVFSPGLAATIGLEESILLQHLQALFEHRHAQERDNYAWLSVERDFLLTDPAVLERRRSAPHYPQPGG